MKLLPRVRLEFKPADLWVGVSWKVERRHTIDVSTDPDGVVRARRSYVTVLHLWVCLLPMLPIHVAIGRREEPCRRCVTGREGLN